MGKRVEVGGWHTIAIEMVNKNANCSLEVLTPDARDIVWRLADPNVVAVSWEFGAQEYLVRTEHIVRVIVEPLDAGHLDDGEREELLETATATTRSVQVRTRESVEYADRRRYWHLVWPPSEETKS